MEIKLHYARCVLFAASLGLSANGALAENSPAVTQSLLLAANSTSPGTSLSASVFVIPVTGRVIGENGEGLPGVTVQVKGTTTGATTNVDGNFSLNVPDANAVLVISYVGYLRQEIPVGNQSVINVSLKPDVKTLEEVVVVGYGTQKKANITGAIAQIDAQNLTERPIQRVDQALVGQMAGVRVQQTTGVPGRGFNVQVRGTGSINAGSQPLYVIDGFPLEGSGGNPLDNINPNDIESIQVLKDASSAAIYGSRASNGVVLITTKRGKQGKAKIGFNTYAGWNETAKKLDVLSAEEWIDRATEMIDHAWVNSASGRTVEQTSAERLALLGGKFNRAYIKDDRWTMPGHPGLQYVDWQDEFFRRGQVQNYQLTASGGTDNVRYFLSGDYLDQEGIAKGVDYKRYTARANVEVQANSKLKFGLNLSPTYSILNDPGVEGKDAQMHKAVGMAPVVEADAGLLTGVAPYEIYRWGNSSVSPVAYVQDRLGQTTLFRTLGTIYGDLELLKGLSLRSTFNIDHIDSQGKSYTPGRLNRNGNISGGFSGYRRQTFVNENTLTYDTSIGGVHNINAVGGMSYNTNHRNSYTMSGVFTVEGVQTLNAAAINASSTNTNETQNSLLSYFGRVNYNFKERYLLGASIRRDGSSRFGSDTKWGIFPSLSLGWRVSDESFMQDIGFISELKARGSWGITGNHGVGDYEHISTLSFSNYSFGNGLNNGLIPGNIANPLLGWEESETYNVGLDFGVLENRIYTSFDYYTKRNSNLLLRIPVPSATGFTNALTNIGEVLNKGWELEVTTRNLTGGFKWDTNINFSHNRNEVVKLGPENAPIVDGSWDIGHRITMVGQPINTLFLVRQTGILSPQDIEAGVPRYGNQQAGDPRYFDANGDGKIDENDRILSGHPNPTHFWGVGNTFSFKGFDLNVLVQGQWGGQVYSTFGRAMDRPGMDYSENALGRHRDRWRSPEDPGNGEVGKAVSGFGRIKNTDWLYSSDYWRVRNITLGYDLGRIISNNFLSGARIYTTAENFFGGDKYAGGFNPEAVNNDGDDYGAFPLSRSVVVGLNLTF